MYGRIRPIIAEDSQGSGNVQVVVTHDKADDQIIHAKSKGKMSNFELTHVFDNKSTQEQVFDQVKDLLISVTDGFNVCMFAYGQWLGGQWVSHLGGNERGSG